MMLRSLSAAFVLSVVAGQPLPPGTVDCKAPKTATDKLICANPALVALDDRLGRFYGTALDFMDGSMCMKNDQRAWLDDVRDKCTTPTCLRDAYQQRLGTLSAMQPGMNGGKATDLPATRRLRFFIAPVDPVDANRIAGTAPFEGRGVIEHELDKGGFVVRTPDGAAHTIISDLAVDPGAFAVLDQLRKDKTPVIVTGPHGIVDKTQPAFDNHGCIAVYSK